MHNGARSEAAAPFARRAISQPDDLPGPQGAHDAPHGAAHGAGAATLSFQLPRSPRRLPLVAALLTLALCPAALAQSGAAQSVSPPSASEARLSAPPPRPEAPAPGAQIAAAAPPMPSKADAGAPDQAPGPVAAMAPPPPAPAAPQGAASEATSGSSVGSSTKAGIETGIEAGVSSEPAREAKAAAMAVSAAPLPPSRPAAPAPRRRAAFVMVANAEPAGRLATGLVPPAPAAGVSRIDGSASGQGPAPSASLSPDAVARPSSPAGALAPGICGDPLLQGEVMPPLEGPGLCGIPLPVLVTGVEGVPLEPPVEVNCRTARTLAAWLVRGPLRAAKPMLGSSVKKVRMAGGYSCRKRNSNPTAKLSEHSIGNAVDVRAFVLADGREISPLRGWRKGQAGEFLLQAWRAACGPFGTVLGPDADVHHQDHLHLDVAARTTPYCR